MDNRYFWIAGVISGVLDTVLASQLDGDQENCNCDVATTTLSYGTGNLQVDNVDNISVDIM